MSEQLHVVTGHPNSDIGKGWIAAFVGADLGPSTPVIKIDPMLSSCFPVEIGVLVDGTIVTDDAATYASMGLGFSPDMNIVMGGWITDALQQPAGEQGRLGAEAPKITYADLAHRLAGDIYALTEGRSAVIEVGGCPDDEEAVVIANAVRILMSTHGYEVFLHVVCAYEYTTSLERGHDIKTRPPVRAIVTAMKAYWGVPIGNLTAYVRRANLPESVTDDRLREATEKVAYKALIHPTQVFYVPNLSHPRELEAHVASLRAS